MKKEEIYIYNKVIFTYIRIEKNKIYSIDLKQEFNSFIEFEKHIKEHNYKLSDIPSFRKE